MGTGSASDRPEPPHVHIAKDGHDAKVWLTSLEVAFNKGYNDRDCGNS
ncbi:MAG: DUF4160 domain-containing protein [Rhizobiaceae bacterium]